MMLHCFMFIPELCFFFPGQFVICYVFLIQLLPRVLISREIYASFGGLLMMLRGDPHSREIYASSRKEGVNLLFVVMHATSHHYSCTTYSLACQPEPQKGSKNRLPVTKTD